eukprot:scaffold4991_cov417-Prasinococcus_capsulatus_cf.AAC.2
MLGEAAKEVNLDEMIPKSEADFITYGKLVAKKVAHFESSIHYATMLKVLINDQSSLVPGISLFD